MTKHGAGLLLAIAMQLIATTAQSATGGGGIYVTNSATDCAGPACAPARTKPKNPTVGLAWADSVAAGSAGAR